MNTAVKVYTTKDKTWINAAGDPVPVGYVTKPDIKKESMAAKIRKAALNVENELKELHTAMNAAFAEVKALVAQEFEIKNNRKKEFGKGAFTWFNFDKSIKIEAEINDIVKWDNSIMTEALACLNSYINGTIGDSHELVKELVNDAFTGSKGMIDTRKVFQLLKYEPKIKDKRFQKACALIKQASSVDKTKLYMRVSEKMENGEYRNINLNFSSL